jgi:thiol-disulfide isomerase/thioredoxin
MKRLFNRRTLLELFWMTVFLAMAAVLMLVGASLSRAEPPTANAESLSPLPSPLSPILLAFHAEWCGPCRQMQPVIDALGREGYSIRRVDIDRERELAARFGVNAVPCFIVVERGKEVDRIVGLADSERLKLKLHRPTTPQTGARVAARENIERRPHPAWRYEKPVGHRAAVVRIFCQDDFKTRSIGSGTLVRWAGKKILVLTARHVIQNAKSIVVELFTKKTHKARVLTVDAVWDCAVLEVIGQPEGVVPAEVELGDTAMQTPGNRLESCGYGPDGRLAANTGLFIGYKRSTQAPNGPDDWFEISGHARQGDSGGGVFNTHGRLVGLLWGTDGQVVVGVQAGRLHLLLDAAVGENACPSGQAFEDESPGMSAPNRPACGCVGGACPRATVAGTLRVPEYAPMQFIERHPTAPKPSMPLESLPKADCDCGPNACPMPGPETSEVEAAARTEKPKAVLPWRGQAQSRDAELDARTRRILDAIEADRRDRLEREPAGRAVEPPKVKPKDDEPSPLLAGLCVLAAVVVGFVVYFAAQKQTE